VPSRVQHRYVVIGAGAIGGCVGGVLARADVPVVLVARGRNAEVLAAEGLTLHTPDGTFRVPVVVASPEQVQLTETDVLIFATKTQQLDKALREWVDRPVATTDGVVTTAGQCLPVLTALNGVAAEELALRYFARVYGVCVWCPAVHINPGEVIVRSWPVVGQFHVSRWPTSISTAQDADFLSALQKTWSEAGINVRLPDDVAPWKYNKLLMNLNNAVGALSEPNADVGWLRDAVVREGEDVLRRLAIEYVSFETSTAARTDGPTPRAVPGFDSAPGDSTSQSLHRRTGNVETDYLNGEIVRLAHLAGTTAPVNAAVTRLARRAASAGMKPGGYTAQDLASLVEHAD